MKKFSMLLNFIYIYRKLLHENARFGLIFFTMILIGIIIPLTNVLFPKVIIATILSNPTISTISNSLRLTLVLIIFFLITTVARATQNYFSRRNNFYLTNLGLKLKEDIQQKSMLMEFKKTEDTAVLNKIQIANECIGKSKDIIETSCNFVSASLIIIVYLYLLSRLNFFLMAFLVLNTYINGRLLAKTKVYDANLREDRSATDRRKNYLFQTMFDYNFGKDIRLFNMKYILVDKFMEQRDMKQKLNISVEKKMFGFSLLEGIFYFAREVLVYTVLLTVYLNNQLTIDNFLMYVSLVASFGIISKGITEDIGKIVELSRYITDYRGFVDEEDDDDEQDNLKKVLEQKQWDSFTIEFKNVSFKYPNSEKYVLKNINFVIEKGDHISIVGFNGSGKTTIVKLLCRFYEPTDGAIYFNGVNIAEYSKKSCRKSISAVFQESKLFAFSMLENITLDSEELNKEEFWKVIERVGMKKKIEELNNKEYTNVLKNLYDGGVEFSGGEKQRLYIARAMFKDNHLLLLDEPTAALDALAEKKIYENFSEISKGKTTIFISHRLNSNKFCNKVILLEQGKIVAQGSHEDMLLKCEAYKSLYQMQAHYYIDTKDWGSTAYETI